ncbi:quinone oxidoreductase family protein [Agromyces bauzanensis]|uniref:NADPH:quinone reductase n=1 Tax=Agromyces bauzanensis TaxID=1308924 RepID=A0A917UT21_9MICO|nr:zinc-binding dehydrogenase [Agromyces bauzanensis]GGJ83363.1 NADPH:quinone reductase [Agromyces bauzanensis]
MTAGAMRAAVVAELGGAPEAAVWASPDPGAGQALIRVSAAALNAVDLLISGGRHPAGSPPLPHVPGVEGVGVVLRAPTIAAGTRVRFQVLGGFAQGSLAELIAVDEAACVEVPDGIDDETAAAAGVVGVSALVALRDRALLQPGQRVLVLGATGAFGRMLVQFARLLGASRVVAAGRDRDRLEPLLAIGADETLTLDALAGSYDLVVDPLWGPAAATALGVLAPGGTLLNVGQAAAATSELDAGLLRHTGAHVLGFSGTRLAPDAVAAAYREIAAHLAAGRVRIESAAYPLSDIASAWDVQAGSPGHKVILVP